MDFTARRGSQQPGKCKMEFMLTWWTQNRMVLALWTVLYVAMLVAIGGSAWIIVSLPLAEPADKGRVWVAMVVPFSVSAFFLALLTIRAVRCVLANADPSYACHWPLLLRLPFRD